MQTREPQTSNIKLVKAHANTKAQSQLQNDSSADVQPASPIDIIHSLLKSYFGAAA